MFLVYDLPQTQILNDTENKIRINLRLKIKNKHFSLKFMIYLEQYKVYGRGYEWHTKVNTH